MSTEIRDGLVLDNGEEKPVVLIDNGENFENGDGKIPNHDKIEIIYLEDN